MPRHVRKGLLVIVTAGNDKGASGRQHRVSSAPTPNDERVDKSRAANLRTKRTSPPGRAEGGVVRREAAIHVSNVARSSTASRRRPVHDQARRLEVRRGAAAASTQRRPSRPC
ncbi:MAG: 50S ribosomal protein L24 [Phycisphaerales bacterium]